MGDTKIKELRPDKEVFDSQSLTTLEGSWITIDHPPEGTKPKDVAVGRVLTVKVDPPYVKGVLQVEKDKAVNMIENGHLREISCGYFMKLQKSDSDEADFVQTQIRYDHAALGPSGFGRLGPDVCLRLDSKNNQVTEAPMPEEETAQKEAVEETKTDAQKITDSIAAALKGNTEALAQILKRLPEERKDEKPFHPTDIKSVEDLERDIQTRVDSDLELELRARDAHHTVLPDWPRDAKRSAKKLSVEVIQHTDRDFDASSTDSLEQLVQRAELLAKQEKNRLEDQKLHEDSKLRAALSGAAPITETNSSFRATIRDK
jgi:hypothetical protein